LSVSFFFVRRSTENRLARPLVLRTLAAVAGCSVVFWSSWQPACVCPGVRVCVSVVSGSYHQKQHMCVVQNFYVTTCLSPCVCAGACALIDCLGPSRQACVCVCVCEPGCPWRDPDTPSRLFRVPGPWFPAAARCSAALAPLSSLCECVCVCVRVCV
jgi:hypothetical protein